MKHMCRSGSGSNQIEQLCIEYPMLPTHESTPPAAILKPTKEKKAKEKAKTEGKASTKKKKKKTTAHQVRAALYLLARHKKQCNFHLGKNLNTYIVH